MKKALSGALFSALIAIGLGFAHEGQAATLSSPVDSSVSLTSAGIYAFYSETGGDDVSDLAFEVDASGSLIGTTTNIEVRGVTTAQDVSILGNTLTNSGTISAIRNLIVVSNASANLTTTDSELSQNALINSTGATIRVLGGTTSGYNIASYLAVVDASAGVFTENYLRNQGTIDNNQGVWVVRNKKTSTYVGNYLINEATGRMLMTHQGVMTTQGAGEHRDNYLRNDGEIEVPYYVMVSKGDVALGTSIDGSSLINTGSIAITSSVNNTLSSAYFEKINTSTAQEGIAITAVNNELLNSGTITLSSTSAIVVSTVSAYDLTSAHTFVAKDNTFQNASGATISARVVHGVDFHFTSEPASIRVENTRLINEGSLNVNLVSGVSSTSPIDYEASLEQVPVITGTFLQNSGTVTGDFCGVQNYQWQVYAAQTSETEVLNTGTVGGSVTGVSFSKDTSETSVVNTGTIEGDLAGVLKEIGSATLTTLVNTGSVTGAIQGVTLSSTGYAATDTNIIYEGGQSTSVTGVKFNSPSGAISASDNAIYLGDGVTDAVVLVRVNGEVTGDYQIKDNKVYVYGDVDLSTTALTGIESTQTMDLTDTEKVSGNELVFGAGAEVSYRDDGIVDTITTLEKPWNQTTVLSVSNFNRVTVKSVDWNQPIEIGTLSALPDALGEKGSVEIDVSSVHFKNIEEVEDGAETEILKIQNLEGTLTLTTTESTYTVGTSLTGDATASLKKTYEGNDSEDTVLFRIVREEEDSGDDNPENNNPKDNHSSEDEDPVTPTPPASLSAQAQTHGAALAVSAATTMLTQGADAIGEAASSLQSSSVTGSQVIGAVSGAASRQKTGSHVNVKSLLFAVGVGSKVQTGAGIVSGGVVFEGGYGKFKNVFDAADADPYINKKGHVTTYGLAVTGAFESDNGWHVSGLLRGGRVSSRQHGALWDASSNQAYGININAPYFGAEFGAGKRFAISNANDIDLYAKYTFTYQGKDDFKAGTSDIYTVDAVTSHRVRLGARFEQKISTSDAWYAGLAYEHEFDGKARVKVANGGVSAFAEPSDIDGSRAFAELGFKSAPEAGRGFAYDAAIKGLYGSGLRSVRAELHLNYIF